MADYDNAEITERERLAAEKQKQIANHSATAAKYQADRQRSNYDLADIQNRSLADVQLKQNSRKTEADRFEAQRNLRNAAIGLMGSMNQAMNGSAVGNLMRMLEDRSDADNQTYWNQHQTNQNAVENAFIESYDQNRLNRNDVAINTAKALFDIEDNLAANLNNINPKLYSPPGEGDAKLYATEEYEARKVDPYFASVSGYPTPDTANTIPNMNDLQSYRLGPRYTGYIMPDTSAQSARDMTPRNRLRSNDYFSRLVNRFNGRS